MFTQKGPEDKTAKGTDDAFNLLNQALEKEEPAVVSYYPMDLSSEKIPHANTFGGSWYNDGRFWVTEMYFAGKSCDIPGVDDVPVSPTERPCRQVELEWRDWS